MFTVKRERTGRILNEQFDHEVTILEGFATRREAATNLQNRYEALKDDMPFHPSFKWEAGCFTMTITDKDYDTVTRFYIEEA